MNLKYIVRLALVAILIFTAAVISAGCDRLEENLPECEHGLRLRFTYTWNMEFANAFPSQVDCLTIYIYDSEEKLIKTIKESEEKLADENYRLEVDLPDGEYTIVAYGGMACDDTSFFHDPEPAYGSLLTSLKTELYDSLLTEPEGKRLHNLFYGRKSVTVTSKINRYVEETIDMMRDTNNLRIMLQHVDGSPINDNEFKFTIIDNNTLMSWDNSLLPSVNVNYYPWARGTLPVGITTDNDGSEVKMAYAEFSLCRLVEGNDSKMIITNAESGNVVVDIPLLNYLLASKSEQYKKMPAQEYFDRQHDWNMTFFLDSGLRWVYVEIKVLDWVVRINNNIEL